MTPAWIAFEIAINFFESWLYVYFLKSRIHIRRVSKTADVVCILVYTLFLTSYLFFDISITDCIGIFIHFIYLLFVSSDPWQINALWVIISEVLVIAIIGIMTQIFLIAAPSYEVLLSIGPFRIVFVLTTNLALFIIFFTFSHIKPYRSPLSWYATLLFFVMNAALLLAMEMLFSLQVKGIDQSDAPFFVAYAALIGCSILSVVLFHLMTNTVQRQHEAELSLNHERLTAEHQQVLKDMYTDLIARQHDFKHQLQTLDHLVQGGKSEEAKAYLCAYRDKALKRTPFVTGCVAADALLTAKLLSCQRQGVEFRLVPQPLSDLPIDEIDFCAIVGNLLDNAIEGTLRIPPGEDTRWVHLTFSRIWDTFIIRCENSVDPSTVKKHGGHYVTTKKDFPSLHGYGIRNIESIAQRSDGFCRFEIKDRVFIAVVTLPYPIKEDAACNASKK